MVGQLNLLFERRQLIVGTIATVILVIAVIAIVRELIGPPIPNTPARAWFYDLNTGKLFAGLIDQIPPIPAPSGPLPDGSPAGVLAHVYSCKTCAEADRVVVYLETRSPESAAGLRAFRELPRGAGPTPAMMSALGGAGILVKRPTDVEWVIHHSPDARPVEDDAVLALCENNATPRPCLPEHR